VKESQGKRSHDVKESDAIFVGQKVWFYHYSTIKQGTVANIPKCGGIVYLTDGRWLHVESCNPVD
jgi:hypothetical protein